MYFGRILEVFSNLTNNILLLSYLIFIQLLSIQAENPPARSNSFSNQHQNLTLHHKKTTQQNKALEEDTYTFIIYMSADNDLFPFAGRNIAQLKKIGSNKRIKIAVHLDMHRPGQRKVTKRLYIEKNKYTQSGPDLMMDSGDPASLIDCCRWAIKNFPSKNYVLVLWNHGTGILEPVIKRAINPAKLFSYDPETKIIKLNRSIGFIDFINNDGLLPIEQDEKNNASLTHATTLSNEPSDFEFPETDFSIINSKIKRGICFDDTTGNYLTNVNLKNALEVICNNYLNGKKFNIIACDACLMAMLEVACPLSRYANFLVSSQEVELGTGYNYESVLAPFSYSSVDPKTFAMHIVKAYTETYGKITHDYTQSAIDLGKTHLLQKNISKISNLLMSGLKLQKNRSVKETIQLSKHKNFCTHFDEPTYIDLSHFYTNMLNNISRLKLQDHSSTHNFKRNLEELLIDGRNLINSIVIANTAGKNLKEAKGISIYFPEHHIHSSYLQSETAKTTGWLEFLYHYIRS